MTDAPATGVPSSFKTLHLIVIFCAILAAENKRNKNSMMAVGFNSRIFVGGCEFFKMADFFIMFILAVENFGFYY